MAAPPSACPRLVGVSRAKDLIYTGRQVGADEALRIGLADRVVARDRVLDEALALAAEFAAGPLVALAAAKRVIDDGARAALPTPPGARGGRVRVGVRTPKTPDWA